MVSLFCAKVTKEENVESRDNVLCPVNSISLSGNANSQLFGRAKSKTMMTDH